jgi:hypothetical protein
MPNHSQRVSPHSGGTHNLHTQPTTKMNKAILIKLYNEAVESTTDLIDMGRKELAQELLRDCNSFIQDHYPNFEDKTIDLIDDLEQVIWGLDEKGSHARMLKMHLGYSHCFDWLVKEVAKVYSLAVENKIAKASAYDAGFKDGLNTGEENSLFEDGDLKRAYRDGYTNGVREYCEKNHQHLKIETRHDEHLVANGDTVDLILPDGSVGSFRHNGEALIVSLYQTRLVDDNWDDVWEGKLYEFEIPQDIPSVTDEAVEKAMDFFNPKCEK